MIGKCKLLYSSFSIFLLFLKERTTTLMYRSWHIRIHYLICIEKKGFVYLTLKIQLYKNNSNFEQFDNSIAFDGKGCELCWIISSNFTSFSCVSVLLVKLNQLTRFLVLDNLGLHFQWSKLNSPHIHIHLLRLIKRNTNISKLT